MEGTRTETPNSLLNDLLDDQQDLAAVVRYAQWHDDAADLPNSRVYQQLIPLTAPRPGEQYRFEVTLDKCSGCKACVSACHSLNGLDPGESWRTTGLLVSDDWRQPYQQTITTACHHCIDPGCLNGCPVLAYDKDPATGIVRHLDDQCIGCQYCVMKCPYDVPKFSKERGIVRKCDMCTNRLAVGEAPACVQACPNEAIRITIIDSHALVSQLKNAEESSNCFLPSSPSPRQTLPTTRYQTARPLPPSVRAADREQLRPEPAHMPLVYMLVLTQFSVGLFLVAATMRFAIDENHIRSTMQFQLPIALAIGIFGLAASMFHLGRPLGAWRSFLGLRRSWLSREIVVFGIWSLVAMASVALFSLREIHGTGTGAVLEIATATSGLFGVVCSAMVYHDTKREFWQLPWTLGKFIGTTLLLGAAGTLFGATVTGTTLANSTAALGIIIAFAGAVKLAIENRVMRHLSDDDFSPLHKTALLLSDRFGVMQRTRICCCVIGAFLLPCILSILSAAGAPEFTDQILAGLIVGFCFAGELLERRLFFIACQPLRMPGTTAT